jgi:L-asparagine oxygenase
MALAIPTVADEIGQQGYITLRGHRPEACSFDALSDLGQIEVVEGLSAIQSLTPQDKAEALSNTYSGNFGLGEFPLHTDLAHWVIPPRYLALRCIRGVASVGTRLFDGRHLIERFGADLLRTILVQPRRPMRNGLQLIRLLERVSCSDEFRLRWDSIYLKPASVHSSKFFCEFVEFIKNAKPFEVHLLERGDTLIIDNWRYLHGRATTDDRARERKIDRAYLGLIA